MGFGFGEEKYAGQAEMPAKMLRRDTVKEQIAARAIEHKNQLQKLNRLAELLEKNPDFEELLNLTREVI